MSSSSECNKKAVIGKAATILTAASVGVLIGVLLQRKVLDSNKLSSKNSEKTTRVKSIKRLSSPLPNDYMGVELKFPTFYQELLSQIAGPKLVFKHFMSMLSTPRPSGQLDDMRTVLKQTADALNIEYTQDEVGNVCLRKPASAGYEGATGVVIQAHMDMVCTKTDESKFDFESSGIEAYIDGAWLKAKGTTLGADDGIGVAAGLALMEHPGLVHGPLELLITVDEETTMDGARLLAKAPFVRSKVLINVDSEEPHRVCIGCAGMFDKCLTVNMSLISVPRTLQYKAFKLNVSGLSGGHTGIQIQLGRANAIQLLARILNYVRTVKKMDIWLVDIAGGNATNAIPSYSRCRLVVRAEDANVFEESVSAYWLEFILPEFKDIETSMHMHAQPCAEFDAAATQVCDVESTRFLVALMNVLPHGVQRMSPCVDGLVQTSAAFSLLSMSGNRVKCGLSVRSMSMGEMNEMDRKLNSIIALIGDSGDRIEKQCEPTDPCPGWEPVTQSPALDVCKSAHVALFGDDADVYAVHAGLEAGLIKETYPEMDCVSIGPHVQGAHSTDEKLELDTVGPFYDWLVETVARIAANK